MVNPFQRAPEIEINVSCLLVSRHVVRNAIHPAFRMHLPFRLECGQDSERRLNVRLGHVPGWLRWGWSRS